MYLKLFAIPCFDRSGDYCDRFWRFVKNTGQVKGQNWVELTGLNSNNEKDMTTMREILRREKDILLDAKGRFTQAMHDSAVNRVMRRAERVMKWENGLKRSSL